LYHLVFLPVQFSQLPSDNLFLLKKVNCVIATSQPLVSVFVSIAQTAGGVSFGRGIFVNPGPAVLVSGTYNYSFQTDAQILIGQGRYPFIEAAAQVSSSSIAMVCGIVGDIVTPIQ
jgi:Icc-related predicted phosphoesterase